MIVLDTNVLSALTRPVPDKPVVIWLDAQPRSSVWTTAVTLFELRVGIATMPEGRRRALVDERANCIIGEIIEGRILPFDAIAAEASAALAAVRRRQGRPGELRDTMIAGIAVAHRATLATRNTRHFDDLPVPVVNPWAD
jgi:toxin FitB